MEAQRVIGGMVGQGLEEPVTLAIDLHKKPYYGARDDPYVVGGRLKASTTKFHAQGHSLRGQGGHEIHPGSDHDEARG